MKERNPNKLRLNEAEFFIQKEGRELARTLLEEFIAKGGTGDLGHGVINTRGILLRQKRLRTRKLKTLLGEIEIQRTGYSERQEESIFPGHVLRLVEI